ncbi:hypothetical protein BD324DRAFT_651931 [Kockovaella imperatae]|uniref:Uncharacterized protein n=1 Tax=Kockovaella imperatae TaxID=4999 RepID=A0A1Y1UEU1_9TREE|nr:hypothetical protein BD324DRAFT_651931 [Kockovaella imperatae]ORX36026.1 hypothetical protein BD324DRAFT_651931 [Kockovaella imperatae]
MFTPDPSNRRPRPPGSIVHRQDVKPIPHPSLPSSSSIPGECRSPASPLDAKHRAALKRISVDSRELANISLELDVLSSPGGAKPGTLESSESIPSLSSLRTLGEVQPSPPPPYGGGSLAIGQDEDLPGGAPTPPMQDSTTQPETEDEEELRAQRAADAARVLGLNIDFDARSVSSGVSSASAESMDEATIRAKMKEMKRKMRRREQELAMAAQFAEQALSTQEQLLACLPQHVLAGLPLAAILDPSPSRPHVAPRSISSSSSRSNQPLNQPHTPGESSRLFRTFRAGDSSIPFHVHQQRQSRPRLGGHFYTGPTLQQEVADERILTLEQALQEARESEEAQRRLALRLRREMEKLQRFADRAEEEVLAREHAIQISTPRGGVTRQSGRSLADLLSTAEPFGWGSTSYPAFPSTSRTSDDAQAPDLGDVSDRLRRPATVSRGASPSSIRSTSTSSRHTTHLPLDARRIRKKISQSTFLEPPSSSSRRTAISSDGSSSESTTTRRSPVSAMSSSSFRRSPWPSPRRGSTPIDPEDEANEEYPFPTMRSTVRVQITPRPSLSPAFASLSRRMQSMRAFVSSALDPDSTFSRARTLGSELGDAQSSWDISMQAIERTLMRVTEPSPERTEDESTAGSIGGGGGGGADGDSDTGARPAAQVKDQDDNEADQSFESDGPGHTPEPLPAHVSAALSSLALALAPATISPYSKTAYSEAERDSLMQKITRSLPRIKWALSIVSPLARKGPMAELVSSSEEDESPDELGTEDPWAAPSSAIHRPGLDQMRRRAAYRLSLPLPARPTVDRQTSDSSIALAHRRVSSQQLPTLRTIRDSQAPVMVQSEFCAVEMQTIPGRLVHDLICLLAILLEFVECTVVIVFRVVIDVRYNRKSTMALTSRSKGQRYYF